MKKRIRRSKSFIKYPCSAMRITISIAPFCFWWKPDFVHNKRLPEMLRQEGHTIWWFKWLFFKISYSRWL